ncbi:MAG: sulfotransferase, partial [Actinomycetota bacterium]|nr:sulfotransferase [Actinomycetota bacterium]
TLHQPVFIIGAPRSGTSLLYAILRQSSHLKHYPGESHEIWEADYHPALRGWESNALTAADLTDDAAARIRRSFFLVAGRKHRLLDKTPRNALRIPFIEALFPDATYVYLQRDGRENVNSLINAWRTPRYRTYELPEEHSIPGVDPKWWKFVLYPGWRDDRAGPLEVVCAKQWVHSNDHALAASEEIGRDRWVEIRYEDLVARPVDEVGRVLELLNVPYEGTVKDKAAATGTTPINVVTPPERGKWRRENPAEIAAILPLLRPTMAALGYADED